MKYGHKLQASGWALPVSSSLQAVKKIILFFYLTINLGYCRMYLESEDKNENKNKCRMEKKRRA